MIDIVSRPKPAVLCILDGWGDRPDCENNAIRLASTPNWDRLWRDCPSAHLRSSALDVGLPEGQMGNSEVGHMNLGAGRVVMQDLPRIDAAIADGSLMVNPVLCSMIDALKKSKGVCHLMGLLSPGGVHSQQIHMSILANVVAKAGIPVKVHAFLDGRDTPPRSAEGYIKDFLTKIDKMVDISIATIGGRYYAMDRDNRWERIKRGYLAIAEGQGNIAPDVLTAIAQSYATGKSDEFILPTVIDKYNGMKDGDAVLMANFRADRVREILTALCDSSFDSFSRPRKINLVTCVGMTRYSRSHDVYMEALFPPLALSNILGQVISEAGLVQLRIAETEKYAHVTFFFNGGREKVFEHEERILISSPKVATYDLQPAMSAFEVTDKLTEAIQSGKFDLIIVNYANGDMVGHTGILKAAMEAVSAVDTCLGKLEAAVKKAGGVLLITSDHGNAEQMEDLATNQPHTAHTLNPVPIILVNAPKNVKGLRDGRLADVAPTLLQLIGLLQPEEMSGCSLIQDLGVRTVTA